MPYLAAIHSVTACKMRFAGLIAGALLCRDRYIALCLCRLERAERAPVCVYRDLLFQQFVSTAWTSYKLLVAEELPPKKTKLR